MNSKASRLLGVGRTGGAAQVASSTSGVEKPRVRSSSSRIKKSDHIVERYSPPPETEPIFPQPPAAFHRSSKPGASDPAQHGSSSSKAEVLRGRTLSGTKVERRKSGESSLSVSSGRSASSRASDGTLAQDSSSPSVPRLPKSTATTPIDPQEIFDAATAEVIPYGIQRQLAKRTKGVPAQLLLRKMSLGVSPPSPPPKSPLPSTPTSARQASSGVFLTSQGLYCHGAIAFGKKGRPCSVATIGEGFGWENIIGGDFHQNSEDLAMDATVHYYMATFAVYRDANKEDVPTSGGSNERHWLKAPLLDEVLIQSSAARQREIEEEEDGSMQAPHARNLSSVSTGPTESPTSVISSATTYNRTSVSTLNNSPKSNGSARGQRLSIQGSTRSSVESPREPDKKTGKKTDLFSSLWTRGRKSKDVSVSSTSPKTDPQENQEKSNCPSTPSSSTSGKKAKKHGAQRNRIEEVSSQFLLSKVL